MSFLREVFSGSEKRVSSLIIIAFVLTLVAVICLLKLPDIPDNLKEILIWIYGLIAGGSAISSFNNKLNNNIHTSSKANMGDIDKT